MVINWKKCKEVMLRNRNVSISVPLGLIIIWISIFLLNVNVYYVWPAITLGFSFLLIGNAFLSSAYKKKVCQANDMEINDFMKDLLGFYRGILLGTLIYVCLFIYVVPGVWPWDLTYIQNITIAWVFVLSIPVPALFIMLNQMWYATSCRNYILTKIHEMEREEREREDCLDKMVKDAVEKRVKSERMKVDLIANVSHDLKTPLTSIISYIELLGKQDLSEEAGDYVDILGSKAQKLSHMVESLFDLAKVTSGNAEVKLIKMNLNRLVEQVLLDMEEEVKKSGLAFKVKLCEEKADFIADGNYLYRVMQNLLENTLKYSMQGTRVYITTLVDRDRIRLTILNTASYEMDFTEDEIIERFVRGDRSRTTEGNGLGLAIVKNYTEACGGEFLLRIEGDQFKTTLSFVRIV